MGVTVAYRGRLADLSRIEDFEDRLIDFALEIGAQAQIWRSQADSDPERVVRGVILDLAPGHESTSLLISPEGWLIGLIEIEDAEEGRLAEPPWCFTKTQFGPVEGHVALVEMLTALKREFMPDLEVSDDAGYWEERDLAELIRKRRQTQQAIDALAAGLKQYGLSHEAAEDPNILLRHLERVAEHVHRILRRPSEHPPLTFEDGEEFEGAAGTEAIEKMADEAFKHNRRQQERLLRAVEERLRQGLDHETALREAMREIVPHLPDEDEDLSEESCSDDEHALAESNAHEVADESAGLQELDDDPFGTEDDERHPLLQKAMDLLVRLDALFPDADARSTPALGTLYQGAGDVMGGLAQALSDWDDDSDDDDLYGLRVAQLKRALRGAAFARGALFPLRSNLSREHFDELFQTLGEMEKAIFSELGRVRARRRQGWRRE